MTELCSCCVLGCLLLMARFLLLLLFPFVSGLHQKCQNASIIDKDFGIDPEDYPLPQRNTSIVDDYHGTVVSLLKTFWAKIMSQQYLESLFAANSAFQIYCIFSHQNWRITSCWKQSVFAVVLNTFALRRFALTFGLLWDNTVKVADPYRGLEDLHSLETKEFITKLTEASRWYLDASPYRNMIKQRLLFHKIWIVVTQR